MTANINDENYLISNLSSFGSDDIEYLTIPFLIIEQMLFNDVDSFITMYKQFNLYNRPIFESEWKESDGNLDLFSSSTDSMLFIRLNGTIFDVNDKFCNQFQVEESDMYDLNCLTMFQRMGDPSTDVFDMNDLEDDDEDQNDSEEGEKKIIVKEELQSKLRNRLNKFQIQRMNQLNSLGEQFFQLKDKVYEIEIIKFENIKICDQDRSSNLKRH